MLISLASPPGGRGDGACLASPTYSSLPPSYRPVIGSYEGFLTPRWNHSCPFLDPVLGCWEWGGIFPLPCTLLCVLRCGQLGGRSDNAPTETKPALRMERETGTEMDTNGEDPPLETPDMLRASEFGLREGERGGSDVDFLTHSLRRCCRSALQVQAISWLNFSTSS